LGYNLIVQRRFQPGELKDSVLVAALRSLFDAQLPGGLWEKKEPIFRYGDSGDAHPFSFELLNVLLSELSESSSFLATHEENFERSVGWAERNAYRGERRLWRSGHLASNKEPESWATAEVYFFLQNYRSYLANRMLAQTLETVGRGRLARSPQTDSFSALYQPCVTLDGENKLLGDVLVEKMLEPMRLPGVSPASYSLARHPQRRRMARSGIFFGPPGTGKTTYAAKIADYLGWPMLTVTPSDFAAEGLLLIPTVGRRLFDRLRELEDTVIFFDEMEELMRERDGQGGFEQRFLTTSFLPSLQDLRDEARSVYLVATNNFEHLDEAARAPRRFDFQLQVLPPSYEETRRQIHDHFQGGVPQGVDEEVERAREKIEWATLREAFVLTKQLEAQPGDARAVLEAFTPALLGAEDALRSEAANNSFD